MTHFWTKLDKFSGPSKISISCVNVFWLKRHFRNKIINKLVIKNLGKIRKFFQNLKLWSTIHFFVKTRIFVKSRNFGENGSYKKYALFLDRTFEFWQTSGFFPYVQPKVLGKVLTIILYYFFKSIFRFLTKI